jgi:hypothetical protein
VAGADVVVAVDVVVVVVAVVAVMAPGAVLVVLVDVVLAVSSTTFGAGAASGFFSSGLLQATSEVARATRARADVNFFMLGCSFVVCGSVRDLPVGYRNLRIDI